MTSRTHSLKTWPEYFEAIADGRKKFELRKDDRCFAVGDDLILQEWVPETKQYTGRMAHVVVTYMLTDTKFGLQRGHALMSIRLIDVQHDQVTS